MPLINCHECSKGISDKAPNCPHCGAPNIYVVEGSEGPSSNSMKMLWLGFVVLMVLGVLLGIVGSFRPITDMGNIYTLFGSLMIGLGAIGAFGGFVVWLVSWVAPDKRAGKESSQTFPRSVKDYILVMAPTGSLILLVGLSLLRSVVSAPPPPPDGPFETYYENGQLEEKGTYKDGVQDGPFETYYENGQLWSKGTYKDGQIVGISDMDGLFERYWPNGNLRRKSFREGGIDMYESGLENGQLVSKTTTDKDGVLVVHWVAEYDDNGEVLLMGPYSMGEKCGEWIEDGETVTYSPCPFDLEGEEGN